MTDENMENLAKTDYIITMLNRAGYDITDELNAIDIMQKNNIDISAFTLPYGCKTLAEWKQKAEASEREYEEMKPEQIDCSHMSKITDHW